MIPAYSCVAPRSSSLLWKITKWESVAIYSVSIFELGIFHLLQTIFLFSVKASTVSKSVSKQHARIVGE